MPRTKTDTKTASKRKESPVEDVEDTKRAKTEEVEIPNIDEKNIGNVVGGYKATLKNPNVSDEAKEHAEQVLEKLESEMDVDISDKAKDTKDGELHTEGKNINNVVGGYKATLNNPNVSDEAKEHAKKMLEQLESEGADLSDKSVVRERDESSSSSRRNERVNKHGKDITHVIGGYKATLSNANSSEEAKEHARKMLKNKDHDLEEHHAAGGHLGHVIGGYKATLSNENTSEEAKENARKMLEELGAEDYEYSSRPGDEKKDRHGRDISHHLKHYKEQSEKGETEERRSHAKKVHSHLDEQHKSGRHLGHVIGGYKATLSNRNTSEEAREHARKMLEELGADEYDYSHGHNKDDSEKNFNNVMGGYKATLSNENASEEAKEHARKMLAENDVSETSRASSHGHASSDRDDAEKNPGNVIGGLKGALKNPNNSEEAKDEIRQKLNEKKVAY